MVNALLYMVRLERMSDYRDVGLEKFHCSMYVHLMDLVKAFY